MLIYISIISVSIERVVVTNVVKNLNLLEKNSYLLEKNPILINLRFDVVADSYFIFSTL